MKASIRMYTIARIVVLTAGCVFMAIPFLWMISTAFKQPAELNVWPPSFIPRQFKLDNFFAVFQAAPFHSYFLNSLKMAAVSSLAIVFTSMLAGYIFAKYKFYGASVLFSIILATAIVPFEIYMIPLYLQMQQLDLLNSFRGLVGPYLVMSFGIFFMRQNIIQQIPDEIIESARVEGASEWRIYFQIVAPLCVAPMSALAIFSFIEAWNAFVWPLLVVGDKSLYTMELGLAMFQSAFTIDMTVMSAGSVISILPILVVFIFLKRYIIESVSMTGSK